MVTAIGADGPAGMAIGSFSSVSLDPPLVMFCPGLDSTSWARMRDVGSFCVNVLGEDQAGLAATFAGPSQNRFDGVATRTEATGSPVLEDCLAWIDCRLHAIHEGGDHDIVVGRVSALGSAANAGAGPLLFFKGGYGRYQAFEV